jgi:hypothetical protein
MSAAGNSPIVVEKITSRYRSFAWELICAVILVTENPSAGREVVPAVSESTVSGSADVLMLVQAALSRL